MSTASVSISAVHAYNMTGNVANSTSGWDKNTAAGYASTWDAMAYKFSIGSFSGSSGYKITGINVSLKYRKKGSGTFYFNLRSSDPTNSSLASLNLTSNAFASRAWSSSSSSWQDVSYSLSYTGSLSAGTNYYLIVSGSGTIAEISSGGYGISVSYTAIGDIKAGSTSIKDNYNNTFTITATKGTKDNNNTVKGLDSLSWGYSDSYGTAYTSGTAIALTTKGTGDTRTVYAKSRTTADYGTNHKVAKASLAVKQYLKPTFPSNFKFTLTKTRNRLTIKEPWVFSWTAATKANNTSPVKGYRIRLFKNGKDIPIKNNAGQTISLSNSTYGGHPYDTNSTSTSFTVYPDKYDFKAGDTVAILVHAYTRYGKTNEKTGEANYVFSDLKKSSAYKIQNAGIVQVRTSSGWHEGQVHIRSASGWHEAETVQPRAASGWHESE